VPEVKYARMAVHNADEAWCGGVACAAVRALAEAREIRQFVANCDEEQGRDHHLTAKHGPCPGCPWPAEEVERSNGNGCSERMPDHTQQLKLRAKVFCEG
jgi:hypothetical protein